MTVPHKQLFVAVGIVEHDGHFLMLRRVSSVPMWHHKWNLPGGKVAPGETPENAVQRELAEETGLIVGAPELLGIYTHHWQLPEHTQQTFLAAYRVLAPSRNVILKEDENDAYQWVTLDEFYKMENHLDGNVEMMRSLYDFDGK